MKKTKVVLSFALIFLLFSIILNLGACSESKKSALKKYNDFIAETLRDTNHRVVFYHNESIYCIEIVDGTKSRSQINSTDTEIYVFKDGNKYIETERYGIMNPFTGETEYYKYYRESEDSYKEYYRSYLPHFNMFKYISEDEYAFTCNVTGNTLELVIKNSDSTDILTATLVKNNGLIESFTMIEEMKNFTESYRLTFSYGNASVNPPDLTDGWILIS